MYQISALNNQWRFDNQLNKKAKPVYMKAEVFFIVRDTTLWCKKIRPSQKNAEIWIDPLFFFQKFICL